MTQKFPSLELVSKKDMERRRLPRLNLTTEQFRLNRGGKVFSVADLSPGGMALRILDRADLEHFAVGALLEGTLNLKREKYPVSAKVRHLGMDMIGCQFEKPDSAVAQALRRFLDPAALGPELKPIPVNEGGTLGYHGPSGTDLLFWRKADGQYRKFSLFLLGSYTQWEETGGISTGTVNFSYEQSEVRGVVRFETLLLDADGAPDSEKLSVAKILILSSNLPEELKKWCVRQLAPEGAPNGS